MIYKSSNKCKHQELLDDILMVSKLRLADPDEKGWCLRLNFGTFWVTDETEKGDERKEN